LNYAPFGSNLRSLTDEQAHRLGFARLSAPRSLRELGAKVNLSRSRQKEK